MRILHVISSIDPRAGGTIAALAGLSRAQVKAGMDVTVASTFRAGADLSVGDELCLHGVHLELIGPAHTSLQWSSKIAPALREQIAAADVVHIHAMWEEIQHSAARIARRMHKPYVISPHGMLDPWSLGQRSLKKRAYMWLRMRSNLDHAAAIHCTAEAERAGIATLKLLAPSLVEPLAVDLHEFDRLPKPGTFRNRWPQIGDRRIALFLSRLHMKKGLDLLIPAFAQAQTGDTMLVIAGPDDGGYRAQVEAMVARHGLTERTIFTGMLHGRERVEALADADLFVLPSYQENFGIAVVESLAAGTPVLISDGINIHGQISAGGVGGVVPTQVEPLARELSRWLNDAGLRANAGARARSFVAEHYSWGQSARRWRNHYAMLLGEPLTAPTRMAPAQALSSAA